MGKQRFYGQIRAVVSIYIFHYFQNIGIFNIMFFRRLTQFDADGIDYNIESSFMFFFIC